MKKLVTFESWMALSVIYPNSNYQQPYHNCFSLKSLVENESEFIRESGGSSLPKGPKPFTNSSTFKERRKESWVLCIYIYILFSWRCVGVDGFTHDCNIIKRINHSSFPPTSVLTTQATQSFIEGFQTKMIYIWISVSMITPSSCTSPCMKASPTFSLLLFIFLKFNLDKI